MNGAVRNAAAALCLAFVLPAGTPSVAGGQESAAGADARRRVPHRVVRVTGPELSGAGEVSAAVDPADPERILTAFLATGGPAGPRVTDWTYRSEDGGRSWTPTAVPNPAGRVQGDDVVALSADGAAFHAYISFVGIRRERPARAENGIFVRRSPDGGRSWGEPVPVIDHLNTVLPFEDKPWLGVDDVAGSPHRGNVYVAWTRFDEYGSTDPADSTGIWFSRSVDGGRSFQPGVRISDRGGNAVDSDDTVEGAVPAVGPDGTLWVAWAGPRGIEIDRSTDGGYSFGEDRRVVDNPGGWDIPAQGFARHNGMPVTAVDVSDSPDRGTVHISWIDERNGDPDVFVVSSRDGGRSWDEPVRVNDDARGNGVDQLFTWMSVDRVDGSVNVVFLDRRGGDVGAVGVTLARSVDGGRSFVNYRVDQPPFSPREDAFYGDYLAVSAHGGRVVAAYPYFTDEGAQAVGAAIFDFKPGSQEPTRR